ncbi:MAG: energy transducer TonB [Pseudomonadota bacterium]
MYKNFGFRKIAISLMVILLSTSVAAAQKQFKLRGDPMEGTKMRSVDATSPIPFDKTYDELTDEQKEIFRATYGGLKDTEQPPFPKEGTQSIYKPLIKAHKDIARAGTLFLVAMVDEKGKVENVAVYESPADSMTQFATAVLFNTEFDPASCDGEPCKMEFPFEFKLRQQEAQRQYN